MKTKIKPDNVEEGIAELRAYEAEFEDKVKKLLKKPNYFQAYKSFRENHYLKYHQVATESLERGLSSEEQTSEF